MVDTSTILCLSATCDEPDRCDDARRCLGAAHVTATTDSHGWCSIVVNGLPGGITHKMYLPPEAVVRLRDALHE